MTDDSYQDLKQKHEQHMAERDKLQMPPAKVHEHSTKLCWLLVPLCVGIRLHLSFVIEQSQRVEVRQAVQSAAFWRLESDSGEAQT